MVYNFDTKEKNRCFADLHTHTTASDGLLTPSQLVRQALQAGLRAIGVTDHDSTDGLKEAMAAGQRLGVQVIPGVELNTQVDEEEIHILGYYIHYDLPWLQDMLATIRHARWARDKKMVENLRRIYNFDISFEEIEQEVTEGAVGRPHIARVLVKKGIVKDIAEAFERYIGTDCPAYEPRYHLTLEEGIKTIKDAGGVPVLAHPGLLKDQKHALLAVELGVQGIEAIHSKHTPEQCEHYKIFASKHGLIVTGGSDYHGEKGEDMPQLGDIKMPCSVIEELKSLAQKPISSQPYHGSE